MSVAELRSALNGAAPPSDDARNDAEIARLAALPPLAYERERVAAAEQLGCRTAVLDHLVRVARSAEPAASGSGRRLALPSPEPWPELVDGAALLDEVAATFRRHVAMPEHAAEALALWTVHAHVAHEAAFITPRLAITSPGPRCGKTTTLDLVAAMVPRALPVANVTAAAIFRSVETASPTLLIDEADTFLPGADELRGVLNAGHRRGGQVVRTVEVNGEHEPRAFAVFGPCAVAMIGRVPGTLADRSVVVPMRRRLPTEHVERLRADRLDELRPIASRCARWAVDHVEALKKADPGIPAGLHDRAADNWRILLAIADAAGGPWPSLARRAALGLSGAAEDDNLGVALLGDIREVLAARGNPDRIDTSELIDALLALPERPWPELRKGKPLNDERLARMLKPFGIASTSFGRARGYRCERFADAFGRYLEPVTCADPPLNPSTLVKSMKRNDFRPIEPVNGGNGIDGFELAETAVKTRASQGLTGSHPVTGRDAREVEL